MKFRAHLPEKRHFLFPVDAVTRSIFQWASQRIKFACRSNKHSSREVESAQLATLKNSFPLRICSAIWVDLTFELSPFILNHFFIVALGLRQLVNYSDLQTAWQAALSMTMSGIPFSCHCYMTIIRWVLIGQKMNENKRSAVVMIHSV